MPLLLLLETATDVCSIGISRDGEMLAIRQTSEPNAHSSQITVLIGECAEAAGVGLGELDAVVVSKGPGSYTSLRVGTSAAKGICYALDLPLIAVDTLQSLALAAAASVRNADAMYCPMIDARRMEVYTALYDAAGNALAPLQSMILEADSFDAYFEQQKSIVFCGNGAAKCSTVISCPTATFIPSRCDAAYLMAPAEAAFREKHFEDLAYFTPNYFKAPNITTPKQRL